jgi:hypothetical protein
MQQQMVVMRQQQFLQRQQQQQQQQQQQTSMQGFDGQYTLKLFNFATKLNGCNASNPSFRNDMPFWQQFVRENFAPAGVLRQQTWTASDESTKDYEFTVGLIPRFYYAFFSNGVQRIQMIVESLTEKILPTGGAIVDCPRSSVIYWHTDGHQVVMSGSLRVHFDFENKMELLEHNVSDHQEYVARSKLFDQPQSPEQTKLSPNLTKNKKKQQRAEIPAEPSFTVPKSIVGDNGIPAKMQMFFEVAEVFTHLDGLFNYYSSAHDEGNKNLAPPEALRQLAASYSNNNNNIPGGNNNMPNGPPMPFNPAFNQQNPGQRTPAAGFGPNGPQQFQSPVPGAHLNLPVNAASPANMNMSPAMQHNAIQGNVMNQPQPNSVAMAHQLSQQGSTTGSQGTSANNSPHVTNKKRRASAVKTEMDGDVEITGKVKQSPRVGGKRQKPA